MLAYVTLEAAQDLRARQLATWTSDHRAINLSKPMTFGTLAKALRKRPGRLPFADPYWFRQRLCEPGSGKSAYGLKNLPGIGIRLKSEPPLPTESDEAAAIGRAFFPKVVSR